MALKITHWNIEHAQRLIGYDLTENNKKRKFLVRETIERMNPDILCVVEGPKGEQGITDFCQDVLDNRWIPKLLQKEGDTIGANDRNYQISGTQWIWFLVRAELEQRAELQAPIVWQEFTGQKSWKVNYWGKEESARHDHYRHPQVLRFDIGENNAIEIIGVHLKSKINKKRIERDGHDNLIGEYVDVALEARIKLATEARDVRKYISSKFEQVENPGIILMGDCNDGPGHDYFENQYLFFDLISNLQGEVLMAERFFNHALFDYPKHLRWTAKYRDAILNIPASRNHLLIDHILISQPLCNASLPLVANAKCGFVEHEIFSQVNVGANSKTKTSDHRPISIMLDENDSL